MQNGGRDARIQRLYQVTPSEFTDARNDLVKALKAEGDAKTAATVAKLRKPAWPLWAVNHVAREEADDLADLFEAGADLIDTQQRVLAGEAKGPDLTKASRQLQDRLTRLERSAAEALEQAGSSATQSVLRRVRSTLHAAAIGSEDDVRRRLAAGVLDEELVPPDTLTMTAAMPRVDRPASPAPAPSPPPAKPSRSKKDEQAEREQAKRRAAEEKKRAAEEKKRAAAEARRRAAEEKKAAQARKKAAALEAEADALDRRAARLREQARSLRAT